jgi:hypothetical protein
MKDYIKYIFACFILLQSFSCSNDFLNEGSEPISIPVQSNIIVSPEWGASDYPIYGYEIGNAKFNLTNVPEWLNISSTSGRFENDTAYVRCSAIRNNNFSEIGIYNARMTIEIENKGKYPITASYINEGNPRIETTSTFHYTGGDVLGDITIRNTGNGILIWAITECPEWIKVNQVSDIMPQNAERVLSLSYRSIPEDFRGRIVISCNDKSQPEVVVNFSLDPGNPSLSAYNDVIDFGNAVTNISFEFSNQGQGALIWEWVDLPEWLSATQTKGVLNAYSWVNLQFNCNRSLVPEGNHSVTIHLKTNTKNNPLFPVTVRVRNSTKNSENVVDIEGNITDAWMDKQTDILYLITAQPNALLAYDTKTRTVIRKLNLSKAPHCFSVTENTKKAAIGHSGIISIVDLTDFSVTKEINANYQVFDIEWGVDDWICYTPEENLQWVKFNWINTLTDATHTSLESIYGGTIVKKIPGKNYLIVSKNLSPTGISVYNLSTREQQFYTHGDIGNYWFSMDGNYFFDTQCAVYRTSDVITHSDVYPIGRLQYTLQYSNAPIWIDHNQTTNSLWMIRKKDYYETSTEVLQFEANDYYLTKTYHYDNYYLVNKNGKTTEYPVEAHYVFANNAGTELTVIRNVTSNYGINAWSLEHIAITK